MNHRSIMRVTAVISAFFGLALLFAPNALMAVYQAPALSGPGIYNTMGYGAALIGMAVMNWNASAEATAQGARHVILGTLVYLVLAVCASLYRQLADANTPPTGWFNVVLGAVLALFYARLQMGLRAGGTMPAGTSPQG